MAFFLYVADSPWVVLTDAKGSFTVPRLPKGEYQVELWHRQGELEKTWQWDGAALNLRLGVSHHKKEKRKNKFGLSYPPQDDDEEIY